MSDLMKEANYLRFYYTNAAMTRDKDSCKDKAFLDYQRKCAGLMLLPIGLTVAQLNLLSHESAFNAYYGKIRILKTVAVFGALGLCL